MINSLITTAQQLKTMVEQARLQSEAARDAAVAQAKLQAETEKKEVCSMIMMEDDSSDDDGEIGGHSMPFAT